MLTREGTFAALVTTQMLGVMVLNPEPRPLSTADLTPRAVMPHRQAPRPGGSRNLAFVELK